MFSFTGIVAKENQSYSSFCPELDVASVGNTPEEAKAMLLEAATLHIEGAIEDGLPYLRPMPPDEDPRLSAPDSIVEVFRFKVDVSVHAFEVSSVSGLLSPVLGLRSYLDHQPGKYSSPW